MTDVQLRFPGGKQKAFTMSYDDGVEQDIRLIEIMRRNGLKGTFNINSGLFPEKAETYEAVGVHRRLVVDKARNTYAECDTEVAAHGLNHTYMERLPDSLCMTEILDDRKNLEKTFQCIVRGFAYPFGTFSDKLTMLLRSAGIEYARTVRSTENFDLPKCWLKWDPTCHHRNPHLMSLASDFIEDKVLCFGRPLLFYLWGHAYEFERDSNWHVIEEFASYIGKREDIWYATNSEIYDYVNNWYRLVFSADGTIVNNPTATDLFIFSRETTTRIPSGQTIYFDHSPQ